MPLFIPKDRKSLFRQFLEGLYDAVVITDPTGHVLEVNSRAEAHFGWTQDELIDRPVSLLIRGMSPEVVLRIRRGLDEESRIVLDASGLTRDGGSFACEVTTSSIDLKEPGDLVFTVRNTDLRRKLMESMRAKEAAYSLSHAALFTCSPEGVFTHVNPAFLEMFEFADEDAARATTFSALFDDAVLGEKFARAQGGETVEFSVVADTPDDGDQVSVDVRLAPLLIGRKVAGVVGSVTRG